MKFPKDSYLLPLGLTAAGIGYEVVRRAASAATAYAPTAEAASATAESRPSIWGLALPIQPRIAIVELFGAIQGGAKVGESVRNLSTPSSPTSVSAPSSSRSTPPAAPPPPPSTSTERCPAWLPENP